MTKFQKDRIDSIKSRIGQLYKAARTFGLSQLQSSFDLIISDLDQLEKDLGSDHPIGSDTNQR